ncbi:uncharacterized protein VP01_3229g6 [Puccinia sorghi]|uniref:Uncharacterized protein n=1 Tax=Puccinia sorghi TaxID=27349 RepID=A0A0L6UZ30_9BASI|nr:uncharacterized protein VP01_3229g6 [Puccinia sorghi]
MVKNLFRSGFVVSEESFIGLLFHLSLPNLESFNFVNVACQLDLRMEQGDRFVKNTDLLRLAKNELTLFLNNRRPVSNRKTDKPAGTHDLSAPVPSQGPVLKWCHKCKVNTHYTRDCFRSPTSGSRFKSFPQCYRPTKEQLSSQLSGLL